MMHLHPKHLSGLAVLFLSCACDSTEKAIAPLPPAPEIQILGSNPLSLREGKSQSYQILLTEAPISNIQIRLEIENITKEQLQAEGIRLSSQQASISANTPNWAQEIQIAKAENAVVDQIRTFTIKHYFEGENLEQYNTARGLDLRVNISDNEVPEIFNLVAIPKDNAVSLIWDATDGVTDFTIRKMNSQGDSQEFQITQPSFTDMNVVNNQLYEYQVQGLDSAKKAGSISSISVKPSADPRINIKNADAPRNPLHKPGWKLLVNDDFDGPTLDNDLWIDYYLRGRRPDRNSKAKIVFENCGDVQSNTCLKLRINPTSIRYRPANNSTVSSIQTGQKTSLHLANSADATVDSIRKILPIYGTFEIRAKDFVERVKNKAPNSTQKFHIAWWTVGFKDKPWMNNEVDIWEEVPPPAGSATDNALVVVKAFDDPSVVWTPSNNGYYHSLPNIDLEFHVYTWEWKPNGWKFSVDNQLLFSYDGPQEIPHYPQVFLLSIYGPITIPEFTDYNKDFQIDYFRAYVPETPLQGFLGQGLYWLQSYENGYVATDVTISGEADKAKLVRIREGLLSSDTTRRVLNPNQVKKQYLWHIEPASGTTEPFVIRNMASNRLLAIDSTDPNNAQLSWATNPSDTSAHWKIQRIARTDPANPLVYRPDDYTYVIYNQPDIMQDQKYHLIPKQAPTSAKEIFLNLGLSSSSSNDFKTLPSKNRWIMAKQD